MIEALPVERVFTRRDARAIDEAAVRGLIESIREVGIINPLRVRPARRMVKGIEDDAYEVTAGVHRLRAARKLEMETVPCIVVSDDDLHAELAMIDENLMRTNMGEAERSKLAARRKSLYEELHPETRHGGPRDPSRQNGDLPRFTEELAAVTGQSERTAQRIVERGEKVCAEALDLVAGTSLDGGKYLDKLKEVPTEDQVATVKKSLASVDRQRERERREKDEQRRQSAIQSGVKDRAACTIAEILIECVHADALEVVRANLPATDIKRIVDALARLSAVSVMDAAE